MRSPDQIQNLRAAFSLTFGPYIYIVPDETINKIADRVQLDVWLRDPQKYNWELKVRTKDFKDKPWDEIEMEKTKSPFCTFRTILQSCSRLFLHHYYGILEIQIHSEEANITYVITS